MKITAILSIILLFIGSLKAAGMCNSCGSECAPACGTRYFRTCCFNYLRKKRGPDNHRFLFQNPHEMKAEGFQKTKLPASVIEDLDIMSNDFKLYPYDDLNERLLAMYD